MAILYRAAAGLAACFLASIVVFTTVLILGRVFKVAVPDLTDFCAFAMAASGFLAMAGTFRSGGHIRVSLVIERLHGTRRRSLEGLVLSMAIMLVGGLTLSSTKLAWDSFNFGDMSTGMIPAPLWIPQLGMVFGVLLLEIALIQEFIAVIRGDGLIYDTKRAIDQEI